MPQKIMFLAKQKVGLVEFELPDVTDSQVAVRTLYSLVSTGTEMIGFNELFDPGTHWANFIKYPCTPGYAGVGTVTHVGADVTAFKEGDIVGIRTTHRSHQVVPVGQCYPIPKSVDLTEAPWFSLAMIAYNGAVKAAHKLGESTLIIGAGPIGQLSVRWALASGAHPVIVVDPVSKRLEFAKLAGDVTCVAMPVEACQAEILRLNHGRLPQVVIDSTGHPKVFATAMPLVAEHGRLVLLGDTGSPAQQCLTGDVIFRELTILGAHARFGPTDGSDAALFAHMVDVGRLNIRGLNTHTFLPDQCEEAYALANTHREETMGIVFDWTKG